MTTTNIQYEKLTTNGGILPVPNRSIVEFTGRDRTRFLHNLCTNDVAGLKPGQGCEAFALNARGKTVGHFFLFVEADRIVLDSAPNQSDILIDHFEHYLVTDDVSLADRTAEFCQLLVVGPNAKARVATLTGAQVPDNECDHVSVRLGGPTVRIRSLSWCSPGDVSILSDRNERDAVLQALTSDGLEVFDEKWFDTRRVENRFPLFGIDITADNLPQEVDRNDQAISFVKGCYLGQETVARIDAMGHVNRKLVGLQFDGDELPESGVELVVDEKVVGTVTSSARSPRLGCPLAMAYVCRSASGDGCVVKSEEAGSAKVRGRSAVRSVGDE